MDTHGDTKSPPGQEVEMKSQFFARSLLAITLATLAGCSADQVTEPNQNANRDPSASPRA